MQRKTYNFDGNKSMLMFGDIGLLIFMKKGQIFDICHKMINRESAEIMEENMRPATIEEQLLPKNEEAVSHKAPTQRLASLDILRGLTIIGMLMVDDAGPDGPSWIKHTTWDGLTVADLVFPSFVFIMGMVVPMSLSKTNPFRLKNLTRILGLFAIGLALNIFSEKFNFTTVRIMGILQRLSLCYAFLVAVHVLTDYGNKAYRSIGAMATLLCLMIYTSVMVGFTKPEIGCTHENNLSEFCNFGSYLDRKLFGRAHLYRTNDPEGLFTTLSAFGNVYAGYLVCLIMKDNKGNIRKILSLWTILGLLCGLTAWPLTELMPVNKKLWSISYTFLTSGISMLSLVVITLACDVLPSMFEKYKRVFLAITPPLIWMGRNPLAIFISRDLLDDILSTYIIIDGKSAWDQIYHYLFQSWISNPKIACLSQGVFYLIILMFQAFLLYRKNLFLKL